MKTYLMTNRPVGDSGKPMEKEEWVALWERQGWVLEPLYKTIQTFIEECSETKATDFDCPNHYAKLAYEAGMREAYRKVLELLPKKSSM